MPELADFEAKTDEELVALVLEDQERYLYLMRRYEQKILRYIIRLSGLQRDDAEDVLQEVFIKAYRNLRDFDRTLKFSSWLYRIAHNETVSSHRRTKSRPQVVDIGDENVVENLAAEPDLAPSFDRLHDSKKIREILDGLDDKYREVLLLRFFEERDYAEISDILRKLPGTVATLLNRAKEKLRQEVDRRAPELK